MSDYPSPWAEPTSVWDDEPYETTQEMLERAERERLDADASDYWEKVLWRKYANRLRADGGLIR